MEKRLFIEQDYANQRLKFWLYTNEHPKKYIGIDKGELIEYTQKGVVVSSEMQPLLDLPYHLGHDLIELIADYAGKNQIKTEKRNFIEGELVATKKHLETMEKITNKLLKI